MLVDGELARCEPKALRYRLLHVAARLTRGQRRIHLRLAAHWPWSLDLAAAFAALRRLPGALPAGDLAVADRLDPGPRRTGGPPGLRRSCTSSCVAVRS